MDKNKDIIWQMSKDYKSTINPQVLDLVFPQNFEGHYIVGSDIYEPEEPLNFWNKIKKKLGLKYKVKESSSYSVIAKVETINGKQVISYEGRK